MFLSLCRWDKIALLWLGLLPMIISQYTLQIKHKWAATLIGKLKFTNWQNLKYGFLHCISKVFYIYLL